MFHEPTRTYFDPLTGNLFEGDYVPFGGAKAQTEPSEIRGVNGGVIMGKLGNETAKYVAAPSKGSQMI